MHTFFCYSNYVKLALSVCESVMLSSQREVYSNQRGSIGFLFMKPSKMSRDIAVICCSLITRPTEDTRTQPQTQSPNFYSLYAHLHYAHRYDSAFEIAYS